MALVRIGAVVYVALLRGINVGGHNPVSMARLGATFESLGFGSVRTYINSGNVVFTARRARPTALATRIEKAIEAAFGTAIRVSVRTLDAMETLVASLPDGWGTDERSRCEVMFLWDEFDRPDIVDGLPAKPGVDDVRYRPGALIWRIDRSNAGRSGLGKLIGTPVYRGLTARNTNTVRKLLTLMRKAAEPG